MGLVQNSGLRLLKLDIFNDHQRANSICSHVTYFLIISIELKETQQETFSYEVITNIKRTYLNSARPMEMSVQNPIQTKKDWWHSVRSQTNSRLLDSKFNPPLLMSS